MYVCSTQVAVLWSAWARIRLMNCLLLFIAGALGVLIFCSCFIEFQLISAASDRQLPVC